MSAQFVIGIDLGTTNSVLSYASLSDEKPLVQVLPIPQLVAANTIESRSVLPSFLYLATDAETASKTFALPWNDQTSFATGYLARGLSAEFPDRTIGAAKSWLCHSKVDRHQPILPWQAPGRVPKLSPVTASQRYLEHLVAEAAVDQYRDHYDCLLYASTVIVHLNYNGGICNSLQRR